MLVYLRKSFLLYAPVFSALVVSIVVLLNSCGTPSGNGGNDPNTNTTTTTNNTSTSTGATTAADKVVLSPVGTTLSPLGATQQFTATVVDSNGMTVPGGSITWLSSNSAVASVDSNGLVTAVSSGRAIISAVGPGWVNGSAAVDVNTGGSASVTII